VQNETVAAKNFMLPLRLRSDSSNKCSNKSQRARQAYNCGVNWVSCQLTKRAAELFGQSSGCLLLAVDCFTVCLGMGTLLSLPAATSAPDTTATSTAKATQ